MRIGIAGAGLIGRLTAYYCLKKGWEVTLFDQDNKEGKHSCGYVAAGMLSPFAELDSAEELVFTLGQRSLALWPEILKDFNRPVFFDTNGTLMISHHQDKSEMTRFLARLSDKMDMSQRMKQLSPRRVVSPMNLNCLQDLIQPYILPS